MADDMKKKFSENLRKYLAMSNKTQADLCRYMGVSSATVSDWCNEKKMPASPKLYKIAAWLRVDVDVLLGDKEPDDSYYIDDYARDLARFLHQNPEYRVAFDATRKVKAEDLETVINVLDKFRDVQ